VRLNILHMGFIYSGGGERVAIEQTRRLRKRGHKVKLYAPIIRWDRCFPTALRDAAPTALLKFPPIPFLRDAGAMIMSSILPVGLRKLSDCDVLLCHSQPSMWIGYRLKRLLGVPFVGYLHQLTTFIHKRPEMTGGWSTKADFALLDSLLGMFGRGLARELDLICHRAADRLIFNSIWTRSLFQKEYGVTGEVCYPGLDASDTARRRDTHRDNMVLTASRHYPWKRIDLAFHVLKRLACERPQLIVVGESTPHTPYLRSVVRSLGLDDYVNFTGFITDEMLKQFYGHAAAYVQTSVHEPFGLGPLESQLSGVPAVVWGDAGVRETVLDGETGFHANPYDIQDFADKLGMILTDRELWQRMSRAARIMASTFDWDTHIDLLESVLDEARR